MSRRSDIADAFPDQKKGIYRVAGTRVSLDSIVYAFLSGQSAEAKRRLEEVRSDAVKPVPWEEAERQIFEPSDGQKGR